MTDFELQNYSTTDLLTILKGRENELEMLKETCDNASQNKNAQEGGLSFLKQQITELNDEIDLIRKELVDRTGGNEKTYIKPNTEYISSTVSMFDLINKINEACDVDDICDIEKQIKPIPVKKRTNIIKTSKPEYKVATTNNFTCTFSNLNAESHQIQSINLSLAGDKCVWVQFFDYVKTTSQNENICLEKELLDSMKNGDLTDIHIISLDKKGEKIKTEVFIGCKINKIHAIMPYDYSHEDMRVLSVEFVYADFDVIPFSSENISDDEEKN